MATMSRCSAPLLFAILAILYCADPAHGQVLTTRPYAGLFVASSAQDVERPVERQAPEATVAALVPVPQDLQAAVAPVVLQRPRAPRGVLPALYAGFGALQTLDAHSTLRALDAGGVEQNPLMRWTTSHPVAFVSMKAVATAGTILVAERIRRKHPKRAMAFIGAINTAYALIVMHNYRVAAQ